jgi:uncharacterized protein YbjT (DUF2867 family)
MILVLGASGTLGRRVVPRLLARGSSVRAAVRGAASWPQLEGAEVVRGDIRDASFVARSLAGVHTVVCAVTGFGPSKDIDPRSVDGTGTRAVIRAAADTGVERFVFVSIFDARADHPMELEREKFRSEQTLEASPMEWTILRPSVSMETWGPIVGGKAARGGKALILGHGDNPITFVSADDVASVVADAVAGTLAPKRSIPIGGPQDLTLSQVVDLFSDTLGARPPVRHVPRGAMRMTATAGRLFSKVGARQARAGLQMDTAVMTIDRSLPAFVQGTTTFGQVIADQLASTATR